MMSTDAGLHADQPRRHIGKPRFYLLDAIAAWRAGASAPTLLSGAPPATDEAATDIAERSQVGRSN